MINGHISWKHMTNNLLIIWIQHLKSYLFSSRPQIQYLIDLQDLKDDDLEGKRPWLCQYIPKYWKVSLKHIIHVQIMFQFLLIQAIFVLFIDLFIYKWFKFFWQWRKRMARKQQDTVCSFLFNSNLQYNTILKLPYCTGRPIIWLKV